jgi:ubiquinone/menaquinone biosynthesis C-methylase UbiE
MPASGFSIRSTFILEKTRLTMHQADGKAVSCYLHHIRSWQSVLGEINRVIKPNGFCIVNDISFSNFTSRVLKDITKNLRVCTVEDIARYFQLKHFEMVHKESPKGVLLKHYSMVFQKR